MSVFKVRLVPPALGSGYVTDPSVDSDGVSLQKTMEVTGPNLVRRRLADGETFTSSNYWKRFASTAEGGSMTAETAFITILTDDGTPYSDHNSGLNRFARSESLTITAGTSFSDSGNSIDVLGTYGGVATFCSITTDEDITVRLNSSTSADFTLVAGTITFDNGDLPISSLAFDNSTSGAANANVDVLMTIEAVSND